ncbi:MAG TPA: hemolysin III family protein [Coriobacteriia bacterium]|nr:hemolysin III family protein [Coriobacteriia bacterium]
MSEAAIENARIKEHRPYTVGEEIANSVIHGLGIGLSIAALVLLVAFAVLADDPYKLASAIVYGVALVLEYTASTLYHAFPQPRVKHVFKILDHCGIYLLIAGTYTPFCLVTLRDSGGWQLFFVVWGLALGGIALEAFWTYRPRWLSALIYLALGWIVVLAIKPLAAALEPAGLWLLVAGGLAYTVGTIFYVLKKVKYMHAVWHVFVLAGSVLHFLAVLLFVMR